MISPTPGTAVMGWFKLCCRKESIRFPYRPKHSAYISGFTSDSTIRHGDKFTTILRIADSLYFCANYNTVCSMMPREFYQDIREKFQEELGNCPP